MRVILLATLLLVPDAEAKNCKKGKPCGNSCIAVSKACHEGGSSSGSRSTAKASETTTAPTPKIVEPSDWQFFTVLDPGRITLDVRLAGDEGTFLCKKSVSCAGLDVGEKVAGKFYLSQAAGAITWSFRYDDYALACEISRCSRVEEDAVTPN